MEPIAQRQNSYELLRLARASRFHYLRAKRWHFLRISGTLLLAAAAPVITFWLPSAADVLAAVAVAWVVAGRTVIILAEDRHQHQAARIQELFDTELFQLPWNPSLAGAKPSDEDITAAAAHVKRNDPVVNWYRGTGRVAWPLDIVLCQRSSAVWGRRTHSDYGLIVAFLGALWFLLGIGMALVANLTLGGYLLKLFLPSQAAFLDTLDFVRSHLRQASLKESIERRADNLWDRGLADPSIVTPADCRAIQDDAYRLRRDGPQVAQWFYLLRRKSDNNAMREAVDRRVSEYEMRYPT